MEAIAIIATALIGGPIMWLLTRLDRKNTEQHQENNDLLNKIDRKVDRLDEKVDRVDRQIDRHLSDHERKTDDHR